MGASYKLLHHHVHLAPLSQHHSSCSRGSSSRATSLSRSKTISALKLSKIPSGSPRFSSDFFVDTRLLKLRMEIKGCSGYGGASRTTCSMSLPPETLSWIFAGAAALLMLLKNTAMKKSFLVPMLALQAPQEVITWIRGEYGIWAAYLALLVRLFYYIPGELELPLVFVLIVITAPYQVMNFRGTTAAVVTCAAVAAYLAYQHFSGAGGLRGSFKESTFLASIATVCLVVIPFAFLLGAF